MAQENEEQPPRFRDYLSDPIIFRILVAVLVASMASALWAGTAIVAFIYVLTDSNSRVGFVEAAQGLANLIFALPVGYLADKWSKAGIARIGAVVAILNIGLLVWAVLSSSEHPESNVAYATIVVAMSVQGMVDAISYGPVQALYADVLPTGTRASGFTYLFAAMLLGSALGPLATIIIFQTCGDTWTLPELRVVIFVGLGLSTLGSLWMLTIPDPPQGDQKPADEETPDESDETGQVAAGDSKEQVEGGDGQQEEQKQKSNIVPLTLFFAGILVALGSGMTVKFFPLWFKNDVGLSPTGVQAVYLLNPLGMLVASQIGRITAKRIGRIQTILLFRFLGLSCLLALILVQRVTVRWYIVVPIYLVRTILMNSTYPLEESVVMDFVPSETRARWKALDSIGQFGWCGSAALGGVIIDRFDYSTTFFFTLSLQGLGTLMTVPLLWVVPVREVDADKPAEEGVRPAKSSKRGDGLHQPLLDGGEGDGTNHADPRECNEPGCVVCQMLLQHQAASGRQVAADESRRQVAADESRGQVAADESRGQVAADESRGQVAADESRGQVAVGIGQVEGLEVVEEAAGEGRRSREMQPPGNGDSSCQEAEGR